MLDVNLIKNLPATIPDFRFKKFDQETYLLTNDLGNYVFLNNQEFEDYISGRLDSQTAKYQELLDNLFIKNENYVAEFTERFRNRYDFVKYGPSLHIVVVTLRCNHRCIYCHASAADSTDSGYDMSLGTAKKVVDTIFQSPNWALAIEFQGGEPILNWPVVKFIIDYATEKNKLEKRNLIFRFVSNFSLLDEEKMNYLLDRKVNFCTSLDGDEQTHNFNRVFTGANSFALVTEWIKKIGKAYEKRAEGKKKNYHSVGALMTVSRQTLDNYQKVIDTYLELGFKSIWLRYLNPFGFALNAQTKIWYTPQEFIEFYKKSLDYILEKNYSGQFFYEVFAVTYLRKILLQEEPNHLDVRSPCGAGIGQLAYNYNGDVYTCDEGRMISRMDDETFKLGSVLTDSLTEILSNNACKSVCLASCTETMPGYKDHVYKPYLGVCPVYNYSVHKQIFPAMKANNRWQIDEAIIDYLFVKLQNQKNKDIFLEWVRRSKPPVRTREEVNSD